MRQIIAGWLYAAVASTVCSAAVNPIYWAPPSISGSDAAGSPKSGRPLIGQLIVAGQNIVLEESYLSDVQMRLGGVPGSRGDAGDSVRWLCYYNKHSPIPWVLWVEALSDLHGGEVSAFQWHRIPKDAAFDSRCQPLTGGVALSEGITLGDTDSQARAVLGNPGSGSAQSLIYDRSRTFKINGNPCGTVSGVSIELRRGHVVGINASQGTAC